MAINKRAQNIKIEVENDYTSISGKMTKVAEQMNIEATSGNLNLVSNNKIVVQGNTEGGGAYFSSNNLNKQPLPTLNVNGYYYQEDGTFLGKIGTSENVYICEEKKGETYVNSVILKINEGKISNEELLRIAGLAYGESGKSLEVIKRIPFIIINHHKQLKKSELKKYDLTWMLYNTVIKMRNGWNDKVYAHEYHFKAYGNGAFREFLGIKLNENIDYEKNAIGRNEVAYMKKAIEYTIKSIDYYNNKRSDIAFAAIGWQGLDIRNNPNWKKWLFFHEEHKKNGFQKWDNNNQESLNEQFFETVANYKGEVFGTTVLYKSTKYAFTISKTGKL